MNEENLRPQSARTKSEQREIARSGGIASGAARRRKKGLAELADAMLDAPARGRAAAGVRRLYPDMDPEDMTMGALAVAGQVSAAAKGNTRAFEALAAMQAAREEERASAEAARRGPVADFGLLLAPPFLALHRDLCAGRVSDAWLPGGRGSTKSSTASLELVRMLEEDPEAHALVGMARGVDLRDAAFAQVECAIDALGVSDHWVLRPGTRRIVHSGTGQLILFRGLNDPRKTKSIKVPFGRIKVMWVEECDQLEGGMADIRTVRQSVTRGGEGFVRLYTFNPPRTKACWVNREVERVRSDPQPGERVYDSCYTQVPAEWLGEQFLADAEALRAVDEESYRHEYLGESVGFGASVFPRARVEEVPDSVRAQLERHWYGVDWGFAADPWCWVKVGYDRRTRTLYVLDEMHGLGLSNAETARMAAERMGAARLDAAGREVEPAEPYAEVQCDSAEPKSIDEWRGAGIRAYPAPKQGAHSVRSSVRWLQDRAAIVIDPRCELAASEFPAYEYERTREGEVTGRLPDRDNHAIDAVRYACARLIEDRTA